MSEAKPLDCCHENVKDMLTRRKMILATLLYAALMAYGSLVPFQFQSLTHEEFSTRLQDALAASRQVVSRTDFLANIVFALPLGFLLGSVIQWDSARKGWLAIVLVVLIGGLYGTVMECLQLFFPPRDCSVTDIIAQAIGSGMGGWLWIVVGRRLKAWLEDSPTGHTMMGRSSPFIALYLLFILVLATAPFDFTIRPAELAQKWREGRVVLVPFAAFGDHAIEKLVKSVWNVLVFLPLGVLMGCEIPTRAQGGPTTSARTLLVGCLIVCGIETAQLFVLSRYFEATDLITGTAAILLGWGLVRCWHRVGTGDTGNRSVRGLLAVLLIAWFMIAVTVSWAPFIFSLEGLVDRWHGVHLIPFSEYVQKEYLFAMDDLLHKVLLYAVLGSILAVDPGCRFCKRGALLWGAGLAGLIEAGQLFLPDRYATVTDCLIGAGGSWVGFAFARARQNWGKQASRRNTGPESECVA